VKACSIIDAPSELGLCRTGGDGFPDALRTAGLLEGLPDVRYVCRLPVSPYVPRRDTSTAVLNLDGTRTFDLRLAERVAFTLDLRRFPLRLGSDCSLLLRTALALRRRGRWRGQSRLHVPLPPPLCMQLTRHRAPRG
jgi:arginase